MKRNLLFALAVIMIFMLISSALSGCSDTDSEDIQYIESIDDLKGKKVGVLVGAVFDQIAEKYIPGCTLEYTNSDADTAEMLNTDKVSAYICDEPVARLLIKEYPNHRVISYLEDTEYGFIFSDQAANTSLRDDMNEYLAKAKKDGTYEELDKIWFGDDEELKKVDFTGLTGEKGKFTCCVSTSNVPFSYIKDNQYAGYEVDLIVRFCKEYGYEVEIIDTNFTGLLSNVASGKADVGAALIAITEERKQSMVFSDPDYIGGIVLVAKYDPDAQNDEIQTVEELAGKKVAVLTGMYVSEVTNRVLSDCIIEYTQSMSDSALMLESGKASAMLVEQPQFRILAQTYPDLKVLTSLHKNDFAYVFPKNKENSTLLCSQMNEFLAKIKSDGTLEKIDSVWFGKDESAKVVDTEGMTAENGVLNFAGSSNTGAPFFYIKDGKYVGYDFDIAVRFCREYGYGINVFDSDLTGFLSNISSGKCDFGGSCITVTEERKESMLFSDPNYLGSTVLVVKSASGALISEYKDIYDLANEKIAVRTGTIHDGNIGRYLENPNIEYANANPDLGYLLDTGKVAGYVTDQPVARAMMQSYGNQFILQTLVEDEYGFALPKDSEKSERLTAQISDFIEELRNNGTLQEIDDIWFGSDESKKVVNYDDLTAENGVINAAVSSDTGAPFIYIKDDKYAGYEIDIITRFCREYGYGVNFADYNFPGLLMAAASGKCDLAIGSISITEERKESMNFTEPHYIGGSVLVVKGNRQSAGSDQSFFDSVIESFNKTFIREDRWRMFVRGVGVTLLIAVSSIILGTVIGFLVFLIYRKKIKIVNMIINGFIHIFEKTPVVVILMILYYVIFGSVDISGIMVSIIGFTLLFASSMIGLVNTGVSAVDKGQMEVSLALGYTDLKAFFKIILPQASRFIFPGYKSEIVSLIKGTAIVGYITVQDLTKVGDIVRSRTYEAFFPIIVTAIIYFVLAWLLTFIVGRIELKNDPKRRSAEKILKGVKTK